MGQIRKIIGVFETGIAPRENGVCLYFCFGNIFLFAMLGNRLENEILCFGFCFPCYVP